MGRMTIPQMNRKLEELSSFFLQRSQSFIKQIQLHEGRFNQADFRQFEQLLDQIKKYAMERISKFFNDRFQIRSSTYQTQITSFQSDGDHIKQELDHFREDLIEATLATKEEQSRKQVVMEHFSEKMRKNLIMKKCFKLLRANQIERKAARALDEQMDEIYRRNLLKKSFFPWRTLTYKDGYANTIRREAEKDISNIHEQYQSIIQILKTKINETDDIIRVKKAAKGEFAYALSKNILKSISNLSMEVMNLNQMSLRDGEWAENSTQEFMAEVDTVIKQKLMRVREYRQGLIEGQIEEGGAKKRKHISFV